VTREKLGVGERRSGSDYSTGRSMKNFLIFLRISNATRILPASVEAEERGKGGV